MTHQKDQTHKKAQTAIEYLLLLAVVVVIVFIALKDLLPMIGVSSNYYFNKAASAIMGDPPPDETGP